MYSYVEGLPRDFQVPQPGQESFCTLHVFARGCWANGVKSASEADVGSCCGRQVQGGASFHLSQTRRSKLGELRVFPGQAQQLGSRCAGRFDVPPGPKRATRQVPASFDVSAELCRAADQTSVRFVRFFTRRVWLGNGGAPRTGRGTGKRPLVVQYANHFQSKGLKVKLLSTKKVTRHTKEWLQQAILDQIQGDFLSKHQVTGLAVRCPFVVPFLVTSLCCKQIGAPGKWELHIATRTTEICSRLFACRFF